MIPTHKLALHLATLLTASIAIAQTPAPRPPEPRFPIGRWVAEHPSTGGIGSWWEFRPDGTLTMSFGVTVTQSIERSGNTFMMPSGMAGGAPVRATYTIDSSGVLSIDTGASRPSRYARLGPAPNPADPLLGPWRPFPDTNSDNTTPNNALLQKVMSTKGILLFTPDGKEYLRLPLGVREGTWDNRANTFHIQGDDRAYAFGRLESKLVLAQMPDGRDLDTYIPDPLPVVGAPSPSSAPAASAPPMQPPPAPPMLNSGAAAPSRPDMVRPRIAHIVEPSYTNPARERRITGSVQLAVNVDAEGRPSGVRVVKSLADKYTDPRDQEAARTLDQKAVDAVRQYTFTPGTRQGVPVAMPITVEVSFQML